MTSSFSRDVARDVPVVADCCFATWSHVFDQSGTAFFDCVLQLCDLNQMRVPDETSKKTKPCYTDCRLCYADKSDGLSVSVIFINNRHLIRVVKLRGSLNK